MKAFAELLSTLVTLSQYYLPWIVSLLAVLVGVHILNLMSRKRLIVFGILPRTVFGLFGIVFAPFIHANTEHLFFNLFPLFILVNFLLLSGQLVFIKVSCFVTIVGGGLVWLFGRKHFHVGASGVIMGYWGYLVLDAWQHFSVLSAGLVVVCLYYLGGLCSALFSFEQGTSWESHLFGFFSGLLANWILS